MKTFFHPHDLHGFGMLAVDSVRGVANLVEDLHRRILRISPERPRRGITGLVYDCIHGVTSLVGSATTCLAGLLPVIDAHSVAPERESLIAALNGVLGDHLVATQNALAIPMNLRRGGQRLELNQHSLAVAFPKPGRKLLVLVHGLCMHDLHWSQPMHDHGFALERDLGYTPIYLHYNSGEHISTNGHAFAKKLEALVKHWPEPVEELVILAHSMGGLVARSACYSAAMSDQAWLGVLRKLIFLGTPHHGSPLERAGNWFETTLGIHPFTASFARLGKIRSAGITDMRYGGVLDEDWENRDRFARSVDRRRPAPLPERVQCYAIGATLKSQITSPAQDFIGDGLVPLGSALGLHTDPKLALDFPPDHQWIGHRMSHLDLLRKPAVYERLHAWLAEDSR